MLFLTGFPGFLGKEILPRLLERNLNTKAICLVQDRFMQQAKFALKELDERYPTIDITGKVELVVGDITDPLLGLGDLYTAYAKKVTEVYHFAAVYDLDVKRDLAYKVNVDGTQHVLDFCTHCPKLKRHHYVSTCYVSGNYKGRFRETDLEKGQTFNNFYDETKYHAEVLVKKAMNAGMPTTIYRPAIVTGDSKTGETQKYDGPYFMLKWLLRFPTIGIFPTIGKGVKNTMNIVPRDFIIDAITALSSMEKSMRKTYNLADPNPLTIEQIGEAMGKSVGRLIIKVPLPLNAAQAVWVFKKLPIIPEFMEIPTMAVAYFDHPTDYDTTESAKDLAEAGITCPHYTDYLDTIVRFLKANPTITSKAMV
ncbi:MAG TPA: SDR family oxidoreductase [Chitinophagales bacterium]|nr:SDR family oxidoreductase [Chitinophagales bacterium]